MKTSTSPKTKRLLTETGLGLTKIIGALVLNAEKGYFSVKEEDEIKTSLINAFVQHYHTASDYTLIKVLRLVLIQDDKIPEMMGNILITMAPHTPPPPSPHTQESWEAELTYCGRSMLLSQYPRTTDAGMRHYQDILSNSLDWMGKNLKYM
jgi:hypothetical protein